MTAAQEGENSQSTAAEGTVQETKRPRRRPAARTRRPSSETKTKETGKEVQAENGEEKPVRTARRRTQGTRSQSREGQTAKRSAAQHSAQPAAQHFGGQQQGRKRELPARTSAKASGRKGAGDAKEKLKIIPLGGLEQIGMNITAFEYGDSIVVVDCGMAFPGDDMLGIDLVIPDITYLKNNFDKVKAFVITHGHEDHIGALPYVLEQINVPVYATKLTMGLIEHKLEERGMLKKTKRKVVRFGQTVSLGSFKVEFIKTNHSIQDAAALAIFSPAGIVLHTGDFKIDYTPVFGDPIDLQRFAELGKKGVLALMADSTNAIRPGFTMSERTVGRTFDSIFGEHTHQRIIVATFASNVDRVQQIVNTAYKYGRKVVVEGRSMVTVMDIAIKLGYIKVPEGTLIDIEQLKNYPPESTVLITTGSQGESMAALSRMAASIHKKVSIMPGDVVILSSTPIPGNEKAVSNVINELSIKGAQVICQDTHVSGHACQEDLKLIYSLVHPRYAIPIHGEYRHRIAQRELAQFMGVEPERTVMINSGDVLAIDYDGCQVVDHVQAGGILVDGLGVGDVGNIVLRDRQNLAQNGIIVVVLTLEKRSNQLLAGPDIVSRGFVYVRESEDLLEEAHRVVSDAVSDCLGRHVSDWGKIKNIIRDDLSDFLWKRMKRSPMILPIIMEV
ncbi:MAG TPA: ribonuclease J [Candidatus Enterocloster faecavium]|uniref:Ribonuclease J n=1 Tax=Candidatus Enterocloster faecavium TaxID=2838560 RepID=A0A9D2L713_9FIRM|nr:ribonuclease J [Candidatus Enterocloster faecavium]